MLPLMKSPQSHTMLLAGFTLIELLLVVAIVATLTAIAIPNFISARVRAQVSRLRIDMSNAAKALESYMIDHREYPPISGQTRLTSPVAYLAAWPRSPFEEPSFLHYGETRRHETAPGMAPTFKLITDLNVWDPQPTLPDGSPANPDTPEEGACAINCEDQLYIKFAVFPNGQAITAPLLDEHATRSRYVLASGGPDEDDEIAELIRAEKPLTQLGIAIYDPTNGTASNGDILLFGPGLGFLTSTP